MVGYISAYRDAIDWLYAPENRSEAIAILKRNLPNVTEDVAIASYDELLHPKFGFYRGGEIDRAGLACVLSLRSRYGKPQMTLNDPNRYIDLRFVEASR